MINVICVHTAMALVEPLTKTFAELLPEVNVNHIADSSLIKEVIANKYGNTCRETSFAGVL